MRQEFSAKVKMQAALRAAGQCEECTRRLSVGDFHFDHIIPDAMGGEPTLGNCAVLCRSCHKLKTTADDVPAIAKAKRRERRDKGIRKQSSFPCARSSRWKKKIDGTVVLR